MMISNHTIEDGKRDEIWECIRNSENCVNQELKNLHRQCNLQPDVLLGDDYLEIKAKNSGCESIDAMELAKIARKHRQEGSFWEKLTNFRDTCIKTWTQS